jgi:hypothetical protein
MTNEYTALEDIQAPGTAVFGYRRGDAVTADVVSNWGLVVGADVCAGDLPAEDAGEAPMLRPGPEANRATWEQWAVANGMDPDEAADAQMEDLEGAGPQEEAQPAEPGRPADSAKKAEWVAYVQARATDNGTRDWAAADSTTKADLQGWKPGDTVALAATEALTD